MKTNGYVKLVVTGSFIVGRELLDPVMIPLNHPTSITKQPGSYFEHSLICEP